MPLPDTFEHRGHVVHILVTPLGKRWHWLWTSDKGPSREIAESGAPTEERAYGEAKADAREVIDAWEKANGH